MRKDKLSSYQAKKEKLKKIKKILWDLKNRQVEITIAYTYKEVIEEPDVGHVLQSIWEIVRHE